MALTRDDFNRPETPQEARRPKPTPTPPATPSPTRTTVPIEEMPCDCEEGPCGFRHWAKEADPDHEA